MNIDVKADQLASQVLTKRAVRAAVELTFKKEAIDAKTKAALIGALVGAGGGGVAGYLAPGEDKKERKRILMGLLTGALAGGGAGYGIQKLREMPAVDPVSQGGDLNVSKPEKKIPKFPGDTGFNLVDTSKTVGKYVAGAGALTAAGAAGAEGLGGTARDRAFVKSILDNNAHAAKVLNDTLALKATKGGGKGATKATTAATALAELKALLAGQQVPPVNTAAGLNAKLNGKPLPFGLLDGETPVTAAERIIADMTKERGELRNQPRTRIKTTPSKTFTVRGKTFNTGTSVPVPRRSATLRAGKRHLGSNLRSMSNIYHGKTPGPQPMGRLQKGGLGGVAAGAAIPTAAIAYDFLRTLLQRD